MKPNLCFKSLSIDTVLVKAVTIRSVSYRILSKWSFWINVQLSQKWVSSMLHRWSRLFLFSLNLNKRIVLYTLGAFIIYDVWLCKDPSEINVTPKSLCESTKFNGVLWKDDNGSIKFDFVKEKNKVHFILDGLKLTNRWSVYYENKVFNSSFIVCKINLHPRNLLICVSLYNICM